MQLEVKIDSSCIEPKVIILFASVTEDVNIILNRLSDIVLSGLSAILAFLPGLRQQNRFLHKAMALPNNMTT